MVGTKLSPQAQGKAYPRVSVVWVSEPPGQRSVFLILGDKRGFNLGRLDEAEQVVQAKVRAGELFAQDRDAFLALLPAALEEADDIDKATSARIKARQASEERPAPAKRGEPVLLSVRYPVRKSELSAGAAADIA